MNTTSSTCFQEVGASIRAQLTAQDAPRSVLAHIDHNGKLHLTRVEKSESVLDLRTQLLAHLSEYPHSNEYLEELRDYCAARLQARAEAKSTGGVSMRQSSGFAITHVNVREVK